jgi:hypothetical protein
MKSDFARDMRFPWLLGNRFLKLVLAFLLTGSVTYGAQPIPNTTPVPSLRCPLSAGKQVQQSIGTGERIPAGTVLPVVLPSFSSEKAKKGTTIKARVAQEVPLPNGAKIRKGAIVVGRVIETGDGGPNKEATLAMRFDTLIQHGRSTPITANLRALASALEVEFAQIPTTAPGESDVYDWLPTRQIGDEVVYGRGGPVARGTQIVGRSVNDGVLVQASAEPGGGCRGEVAGNNSPQALWVFSSDACGVYGFSHLRISHAGRTNPVGEIVLRSDNGPIKIRGGSGALLRVIASSEEPK